jgi:hypothetical protein
MASAGFILNQSDLGICSILEIASFFTKILDIATDAGVDESLMDLQQFNSTNMPCK